MEDLWNQIMTNSWDQITVDSQANQSLQCLKIKTSEKKINFLESFLRSLVCLGLMGPKTELQQCDAFSIYSGGSRKIHKGGRQF